MLAAPFVLVLLFPAWVLIRSGELLSIDDVVAKQWRSPSVLYGPAHTNPAAPLKLRATLARRPRVLVLGTSRMMEFRSGLIRHPEQFYNAGGAIADISHFQVFLDAVPIDAQPDVLIVGLDQYFFNPGWTTTSSRRYERQLAAAPSGLERVSNVLLGRWFQVNADYVQGKFRAADLTRASPDAIGLSAIVHGNGFRSDGSYAYAQEIRAFGLDGGPHRFDDVMKRIDEGSARFEYGDRVSDERLADLERFLDGCSRRGIHVVGLLPPYASRVFARMRETGRFGYLSELPDRVGRIFSRYGAVVADFSDLAWTGATDAEAIDGFHQSEKVDLRIFIRLAEADPRLRSFADLDALKTRLERAASPFNVFDAAQ